MIAVLLFACGTSNPVVHEERLLPLTPERDRLTLDYAHRHTAPDQGLEIVPRMVILHGTMDTTLEQHLARLRPESLPEARGDLSGAGKMNVAVHFIVDRDGRVVRTLPETRYGRHTVGFNHLAIGIEHLGDGPGHPLTEAQIESSARLVRDLAKRHPIQWLAGHHELINDPEQHPLFLELDDSYRTFALDPGDAFVESVSARLGDLELR